MPAQSEIASDESLPRKSVVSERFEVSRLSTLAVLAVVA
jgi:hypothetical protein